MFVLDCVIHGYGLILQAVPEVKVRNNLPAIQMEEATPITMANSGVLAPEEVKVTFPLLLEVCYLLPVYMYCYLLPVYMYPVPVLTGMHPFHCCYLYVPFLHLKTLKRLK